MTKHNDLIVHSNAFSRARWTVESVWEPRLIALLASKVRTDDSDFQIYEIPVSEIFPKNLSGQAYIELADIVDKLLGRIITIRDEKGWTKYTVFSRCRYRKDDHILELRFDPDLKPHYLNLQNQFVEYSLTEFLLLPSIYSQRLYQFLKSWDDKPETTLDIEELHKLLNTPEASQKNYAELKRRVLDKAHKDIHKITKLRYEYEPIKTGRKVTAIRFVFAKKRILEIQKEKQNKKNKPKPMKHQLKALHAWDKKNN